MAGPLVRRARRVTHWMKRQAQRVLRQPGGLAPRSSHPALSAARQAGKTVRPGKSKGKVRILLESGLFDREFYEAQTGRTFETDLKAARHFLRIGAAKLRAFHPLISPETVPGDVKQAWRRGEVDGVVRFLSSRRGLRVAWSPLFDPREVIKRLELTDADTRTTGEVVLDKLRDLAPHDTLPRTVGGHLAEVTWAEARSALLEAARAQSMARRLTRPRTTKRWDVEAEKAWLAEWNGVELPETGEPLVSVIIPVWNRASRVTKAIRSVQAQNFTNWEIVAVDDGSTDGSLEVLQELAAADARIVVVQSEHGGVSVARNLGIERARGRYVAFLDSDNTWLPGFLGTALRAMVFRGLRSAYAGVKLIHGDGEKATYRAYSGGLADLLVLNHIDLNVLVVETAVAREVGGFDRNLRRWVDHDFAIKVARVAEPTLLPFIGCEYDHDESSDRITTSESEHWQYVVLGNAYIDWERVQADLAERVPGRVSVVMPTYQDFDMTRRAVVALLDHRGPEDDLEVLVIDNGSAETVSLALEASLLGLPGVTVHRLPRNLNFAIGSNIGFARSTGEFVLFLNNDTVVRKGWMNGLVEALKRDEVRGAQPLLVYPDDTIQAGGTVFLGQDNLPVHFLAGHPMADAQGADELKFTAVTAAALMMRASEVAFLRGFDPIFVNGMEDVDLCLRATRDLGGHFAVVPRSVIEHHESKTPGRGARIPENRRIFVERWRSRWPADQSRFYSSVGLEVAALGTAGGPFPAPRPVVLRPWRRTSLEGAPVPQLRWSIKNPANPGPRGDRWGDSHFIAALGSALRLLGQEVVELRHGTHEADCTVLDDVSLVIRGLDRVHRQPGKVNVLWVISHPEAVSVEEIREFDLVFAASVPWAERMSTLSGRPVLPLLQCTDPSRFNTGNGLEFSGDDVVFVGQARHDSPRKIVMDAIEAGLEPKVWGARWLSHISPELVQGEYVENARLSGIYRNAGIVLNDHWSDMAAEGFISNRLFDAVASGARVVSDEVEGIDELFDGAVQTYSSPADLAKMVDPEYRDAIFPDAEERLRIAERVAKEHSFLARASELLQAVLTARHEPPRHYHSGSKAIYASTSNSLLSVSEPPRSCVFSSLVGGYESLTPQPAFAGDDIDKILFTDDPALQSEDWEVRVIAPALPSDPGRSSRRIKVMAHELLSEFETSLYIDNSVQLKAAPSTVLAELAPEGALWASIDHSYRGSVLEEAEALMAVKHFDDPARIKEQVEHYAATVPEALRDKTLWTGILLRRHNDPLVVETQKIWWEQILRYSRRDQVSLPYAFRLSGLVPTVHRLDNFTSHLHEWPNAAGRDRSRALGPRS